MNGNGLKPFTNLQNLRCGGFCFLIKIIAHNVRVFMSGFAFRKTCIKHIVIFSLRSISSELHSGLCTKVFKIFIFLCVGKPFHFWNKNNLSNYQTVTHDVEK